MRRGKIAFFDFDGTITTKDTLLEIIRYQKGQWALYAGFILYLPWLLAFKLKFIPNDGAKQKILTHFFGGMPDAEFQKNCDAFADEKIPALIRPGVMEEFNKLRAAGFDIVIVSASAGNWLRKWCDKNAVTLIATRLEVKAGLITGRIEGKNCHGLEKVLRIKAFWNLADYDEIYAYGDSTGDKPMLALATQSFYKPFRLT